MLDRPSTKDRYIIQPMFNNWDSEIYFVSAEKVSEDFSYSSDTNTQC